MDKRIRSDSYQLDFAFQSFSRTCPWQTGAGAGCRSRHVSSRGRAVTAEARAAAAGGAAVAGAGDAAEAGGRCGGRRGGRNWRGGRTLRRQSWRAQLAHAVAAKAGAAALVARAGTASAHANVVF